MVKMQPMSTAQLQSVIDAARANRRDYVMLLLTSNHAMRATEIAKLQISDINLKDGTIRIVRQKGSITTVEKILAAELPVLMDWIQSKPASTLLFPSTRGGNTPMSNVQIYRLFRKYAELAGVPDTSRSPHAFRHSLGQLCADKGMPIRMLQLVMGHKNINSTAQYFSHPQSVVDDAKARLLA